MPTFREIQEKLAKIEEGGSDYDNDGKLDKHEKDHADEKPLLKSLDKDGDGDHDMDDHVKENIDEDVSKIMKQLSILNEGK